MLNVGVIGYGSRVSHMARELGVFGIPYRIAAVADPRAAEIAQRADPVLRDTAFFTDADEMLARASISSASVKKAVSRSTGSARWAISAARGSATAAMR